MKPRRILVCGGRSYLDKDYLFKTLDECVNRDWFDEEFVVIQGGAPGADTLAKKWAEHNGHPCITMQANWAYYGRRAGGLRNSWMLEWCVPDLIIAFPGGSGTKNMIGAARIFGVNVWELK